MALTKITSRILDSSGVTILGTISTGVWQGTAINQTYLVGQSGTNTGDETLARINALDVTELGTISSGVWQGSVIASAYLDADTAHLSTTQTFTGAKTFSSTVTTGGAIDNPFKIFANPGTRSLKLTSNSTNYGTFISWLRASESYEKAYLGFTSTSDDVFEVNNRENADMTFHTNTNERVRILATGNVGIGTTVPQYPLQVKSGTNINFAIAVGVADNTAVRLNAVNDAVTANIPMEFYATKFNFNNGNVGIGTTSPSGKLHIASSGGADGLRLNAGTSSSNFAIIANNQADSSTLFYVKGDGSAFISNGIQFGSNEALDTYDEGTFSPNLQKNDSSGSGQLSSGSQTRVGRYVRVGNQVAIWIYIYMSAANAPATTHNTSWLVQGLPFTFRGSTPYQFLPCGYAMISGTQVNQHVRLQINNSADSGVIYARHHIDSTNNNGGVIEFTFSGVLEIN